MPSEIYLRTESGQLELDEADDRQSAELTGREMLIQMADRLTEEQAKIAVAAGAAAIKGTRNRPRPGTVGVIPGTATRIEYHGTHTAINHGLPVGGHDGVIKLFLRSYEPSNGSSGGKAKVRDAGNVTKRQAGR